MNDSDMMNWRAFTVRLIDSLRWPVAMIAVAIIFREPLTRFLAALAAALGGGQ